MIISEHDAAWAADEFIDYFGNLTSIEDYLRFVKKEVIRQRNTHHLLIFQYSFYQILQRK